MRALHVRDAHQPLYALAPDPGPLPGEHRVHARAAVLDPGEERTTQVELRVRAGDD